VGSIRDEFLGAELGDLRRTDRLLSIVEAVSAAPDKSLPEIARDDAELEAMYRFFENDGIDPVEMLVPHFEATAARSAGFKSIIVIHDTTRVLYSLEDDLRAGLGRHGNKQGFMALPALVLGGDGDNVPLGLAAFDAWTEDSEPSTARPKRKKARQNWGRVGADRWLDSIYEASRYAREDVHQLHVIDAEGEGHKLFAKTIELGHGFVVRFRRQRNVALDTDPSEFIKVAKAADRLEGIVEEEVPLLARKASFDTRRPARDARIARLTFSAAHVQIKMTWNLKQTDPDLPELLSLNLVSVRELNPPDGEDPVEWLLATSEPIDTVKQVKRVVAIYKARWTIEEFFRVVKSGCAFESRQLESFAALQRFLAICLVVAWRVLLLRQRNRVDPEASAETVLSPLMIFVLRATGRRPLSSKPTVGEAVLAVAGIGGHIKNNGPPGCIVLRRGMERLLERTSALVAMVQVLQPAAKK
jgi:hypothetical protein